MAKNYMNEVAQLLGVEFEKEFKIKGTKSEYMITERGLFLLEKISNVFYPQLEPNTLCNLLCGFDEIEKPILNQKEKEYLSAVIKPFKNRVKYIMKFDGIDKDFITIAFNVDEGDTYLPYFEKGTMYKCMEPNKKYTLEDLGL